jgi:hypothetical protein
MTISDELLLTLEPNSDDRRGNVLGWNLKNKSSIYASLLLLFSSFYCFIGTFIWFVLLATWGYGHLTSESLMIVGFYTSILAVIPFIILGLICLFEPVTNVQVSTTNQGPKIKLRFGVALLLFLVGLGLSFRLGSDYAFFTLCILTIGIIEIVLLILKLYLFQPKR